MLRKVLYINVVTVTFSLRYLQTKAVWTMYKYLLYIGNGIARYFQLVYCSQYTQNKNNSDAK